MQTKYLAIVCLLTACPILAEEKNTVQIADLESSWKEIKGSPLTLEFDRECREFFEYSDDPWSGTLTDDPNTYRNRGKFLRDENRMAWIQDRYEHYDIGGTLTAIFPERIEGFSSATVSQASMTNHLDVIELLRWYEPLAAPEYQEVLKLPEHRWKITRDPQLGRCINAELRDKNRLLRIKFAETFNWRIVELEKYKSQSLVTKTTYRLGAQNDIDLPEIERLSFNQDGHPTRTLLTLVSSINKSISDGSFDNTIPPLTDVYDETAAGSDKQQYLVRHDGSKRFYTTEELRVAGSLDALLNEPEEAFGQVQPSWLASNWVWITPGGGLCLIGLVLAFRRQWAR